MHVDPDYVEFYATGEAAVGTYKCSDCSYGISVSRALPMCPMCGGTVWEELEPEQPMHFMP